MNQSSTTITNYQLKDGYKQTEVGVIPEDWEAFPIRHFAYVSSGGTPSRKIATYWGGEIPWITTAQIDFNVINSCNELITEEGLKNSAAKIYNSGTLLMAMYGQGKTRGKVAITGITATVNQACAAISLSNSVSRSFVFHNLASRYQEIRELSNIGNQENLSGHLIKNILVALPPTMEEQELIACTLSDIDALIESLDRLLTKKRQIKQGAMQELLRSKDGWIERQLGDVSHIQTGSRNNQDKVEDGEYPLFVRSATVERINTYSYDCEAILIPGEGGIGSIFHYINGRFDAHQRVYVIREFSEEISGKYVYLYMSKNFGFHAMQNSVKATVDSLRLPTFQNFQIFVPPTLEEQIEIANIFSDMDAEIDSIESKLAKNRQLKQGMMHELLTGRIRLV
jgi:type I restriction enzyme, S subunit